MTQETINKLAIIYSCIDKTVSLLQIPHKHLLSICKLCLIDTLLFLQRDSFMELQETLHSTKCAIKGPVIVSRFVHGVVPRFSTMCSLQPLDTLCYAVPRCVTLWHVELRCTTLHHVASHVVLCSATLCHVVLYLRSR